MWVARGGRDQRARSPKDPSGKPGDYRQLRSEPLFSIASSHLEGCFRTVSIAALTFVSFNTAFVSLSPSTRFSMTTVSRAAQIALENLPLRNKGMTALE